MEGSPLPRYLIRYRPDLRRHDEAVHADRIARTDTHVVLYTTVDITGRHREVIVRRLHRSDLERVTALPDQPGTA